MTLQTTTFPSSEGQITTFVTSVLKTLHCLPTRADSWCSEPLESDLAVQVEYDMDEQGQSTRSYERLV